MYCILLCKCGNCTLKDIVTLLYLSRYLSRLPLIVTLSNFSSCESLKKTFANYGHESIACKLKC